MKRKPSGGRAAVGYGRPPSQHQFRPGQSGNPRGRPKGSKSAQTILREILIRKISARIGGKVVHMSICEAIFTKIAEDALKGDPKAASFLMNRFDMNDPESSQQAIDTGAAERTEIIQSFLQGYLKKQEKQK